MLTVLPNNLSKDFPTQFPKVAFISIFSQELLMPVEKKLKSKISFQVFNKKQLMALKWVKIRM